MSASKPKILFITPFEPWNPTYGGALRSFSLATSLQELGEVEVAFVPTRSVVAQGGYSAEDIAIKGAYTSRFSVVYHQARGDSNRSALPWSILSRILPELFTLCCQNSRDSRLANWLHKRMSEAPYDLVVCHYLHLAASSGALELEVPVIVDVDDLYLEQYIEFTRGARGFINWLRKAMSLPLIWRITRRHLAACAHVWFCKKQDLKFSPHTRVSVLPNVAKIEEQNVRTPQEFDVRKNRILFVGIMLHGPNESGIQHFLDSIWPKVLETCPEVQLLLVGKHTDEQAVRWQGVPNVSLMGFVADLDSVYQQVDFAISPIYSGSGSNCKVVQYAAAGIPAVISRESLLGFEPLEVNQGVLVASTDTEFTDCCIELLENAELRMSMSAAGVDTINSYFTHSHFKSLLVPTVKEVLSINERS